LKSNESLTFPAKMHQSPTRSMSQPDRPRPSGFGGSQSKLKDKQQHPKKRTTVIGSYLPQLQNLIATLEATSCSFIRCVKPNIHMSRQKIASRNGSINDSSDTLSVNLREEETHTWFNADYVLLQLRHLSVTDTTKVLRQGFPTRLSYDALCKLFVPHMSEKVRANYVAHHDYLFAPGIA
jgi:myosin heavy subunit